MRATGDGRDVQEGAGDVSVASTPTLCSAHNSYRLLVPPPTASQCNFASQRVYVVEHGSLSEKGCLGTVLHAIPGAQDGGGRVRLHYPGQWALRGVGGSGMHDGKSLPSAIHHV